MIVAFARGRRLSLMAQHALHRLHRHQSVAIRVHQAEAALHIGAHLVARDAAVPVGIRRPGAAHLPLRLRGRDGWGEQAGGEKKGWQSHEGS